MILSYQDILISILMGALTRADYTIFSFCSVKHKILRSEDPPLYWRNVGDHTNGTRPASNHLLGIITSNNLRGVIILMKSLCAYEPPHCLLGLNVVLLISSWMCAYTHWVSFRKKRVPTWKRETL